MKRLFSVLILLCLATVMFAGVRRNIAVGGASSGNGISTPWNLWYALAGAGGTIQAGDTMYMAAGTYFNPHSGQTNGGPNDGYVAFPVTVSAGTSNAPVIFRADPTATWGTIIWDAGNTIGADVVQFDSPNVWIWGVRIMSSDPNKNATTNTYGDWSFPDAHQVAMGVGTNFRPGATSGIKIINCIIHDCQEGMGNTNWQSSHDCEFYGVLAYNNGYTAPDRDHGHNVYIQNASGSIRKITNCVIWGASENNVQAYGSGIQDGVNQYLTEDMNFTGNIIFQTGTGGRNFLLGQGAWQSDNNTINNNSMYQSTTNAVFDLGWYGSGGGMSNLKWNNNYVGGRYIQFQSPFTGTTGSGNVVWYTDIAGSVPSGFQGVTSTKPTTNVIKYYPNLYEPGRMSVAVFNWQNLSSVNLDLSAVMQNGNTYRIVDAQNPYVVLASGTYSGSPVSVSMTGTTVMQRFGNGNGGRTHTPTEFGAFIVTGGTSSAVPIPSAPTAGAATNITRSGFTANWVTSSGATGYRLDVSTGSGFSSYVSGYQNRDVGNVTSTTLTGLSASTTYYYRVRAYNAAGTSGNSSTINLTTLAGSSYRKAVFLVHSVGTALWGEDQTASTNVETNVASYNSANGFTGSNAVTMDKVYFPNQDGGGSADNNWYVWDKLFAGATINGSNLSSYYSSYPVIIVKTCYIAQQIMNSSDSINAYKVHIRNIVGRMATHTSNFFVLWTNYPAGTDGHATRAQYSNLFSKWMKDTLARGNDSYGAFPSNIYVYDVFHKIASSTDGYCAPSWAGGAYGGDHPSDAAIEFLAPTIVSEAFNAAIAYDGSAAVPPAPSISNASNIQANSFTANWSTVGTATGYYLDVSTSSGFGSFLSGYSAKDVGLVTNPSVTGLTAGSTYYYRARAYNSAGQSVNSGTATVTTTAPPSPPVATAASSITATGFTANWGSSGGATGYLLDVSTASNFATYVTGYQSKNVGSAISSAVTGLSNSTAYYYRVRATNSAGTSNNSNTVTLTTLGVPPSAPTATAATSITATGFTANWNTVGGATGYYLDVSGTSNFASRIAGYDNKDVGLVLTSAVTGLSNSTVYYYRVRAYNTVSASANSNTISLTTLNVAPSAPTATTSTSIGTSGFRANWNTVAGATGYQLDVSLSNTFSSFVTGYSSKDVGLVLSSDVTGLSTATTYYSRVRAYNAIGTSGNSNTITTTTALVAPTAPTATSATSVTATGFTANWGGGSGATGYRLDVSVSSSFSSFVSGHNNQDVGNVTTLAITGLSSNTTYYYRVRGYNGSGTSANSNTVSLITSLAVPSAPVVTAASSVIDTAFTANWNTSSSGAEYLLDVSTSIAFGSFVGDYSSLNVGNVVSYRVHGLSANTEYFYRVRATNAAGTSASSNIDSATTTTSTPPPAPMADSATSITTNSFTAVWDTSVGGTGYRLDVSREPSFASFVSGYSNLDVSNVRVYAVTGLTHSTVYYYRVRAYNAGAIASENSNVITVYTLGVTPQGNFKRSIILKRNP